MVDEPGPNGSIVLSHSMISGSGAAKKTHALVDDKDPSLVAARRGQIIDAAIGQFSKCGYHVATIKDIANLAGVSAGLIYQYVSDKQDLLFLCLLYITEKNKKSIPAALKGVAEPIARLRIAIDVYARVIAANRRAVQLTYRETKSLKPEYVEHVKRMELETNALIEACVDDCTRAGLLSQTHTELLVYRIITGAHSWALKNWRLRSIVTLDQYIEESIHSCWTVLLTQEGKKAMGKLALPTQSMPYIASTDSSIVVCP